MRTESSFKSVSFGRLTTIFACIMLLFLSLAAIQTWEKLNREFDRKVISQMEASLDQVIMQTSDEAFAYARFNELIDTARNHGVNSLQLQQKVIECCDRYRLPVKLFFYQDRRLLRSFFADESDLKLFAPILQGMAAEGEEFIQAQRQLHQMLLDHFGPGHRLELMKMTKDLVKRYRVKDNDQLARHG